MGATVKREGSKVWIEGVPSLGWGKERECTFAGALSAALAVTDHPCSYTDVMGYTGLAFRVRWYHGHMGLRWCPSSPVGEFPQEIEAIQKATGWRLRCEIDIDAVEPDMARYQADIVSSIDAGFPVLAYEPKLNMDVIYGYRGAGKTLIIEDYFRDEPVEAAPRDLGPFVIFLEEHDTAMPEAEAIRAGLEIAVANWEREPMPGAKGKYHYGKGAREAWARDLGDVASLSDTERNLLHFASSWNCGSLFDARTAAVRFLGRAAEVLGGPAAESLKRAAACMEEEIDVLRVSFTEKTAFHGPWSGKDSSEWTEEVREREREILARAGEAEEKAMGEVRKALKIEELGIEKCRAGQRGGARDGGEGGGLEGR